MQTNLPLDDKVNQGIDVESATMSNLNISSFISSFFFLPLKAVAGRGIKPQISFIKGKGLHETINFPPKRRKTVSFWYGTKTGILFVEFKYLNAT